MLALNVTKIDELLPSDDANGNGKADPGDTIRYTVGVQAVGTSYANVTFSDTPGANTSLVVGSVTSAFGTITSGNGAGQTSVGVNLGTINSGITRTITFRARVSSSIPASIAQVSNQGTAVSVSPSNTPTLGQCYNTSSTGNLPIGQEFTATANSLNYVDLHIEDAGSGSGPGANMQVRIRSGSITGTILATTPTVFVPDGTNTGGGTTVTRFTFSSPVAVVPGSLYVYEVVQIAPLVSGNRNFSMCGGFLGTPTYSGGNAVIGGALRTDFDFWFRIGTSALTDDPSAGGTADPTITPINRPPVAASNVYTVDEGTTLSVAAPGILANDSDADSDPLTAVLVSNPTHGSLSLNANGSFDYTPSSDYNGSDSFTYRASEGIVSSTVATVSITVNPVNDQPIAVDGSASLDENTSVSIDLRPLVSDFETADSNLIYSVGSVSQGALTATATNGVYTYTPTANYDGPDTFSFSVTDRGDPDNCSMTPCDAAKSSATKSVSITVNSLNRLPTVALQNTTTTLAENVDTTSRRQVADIVITDDELGSNALSLAGPDAGLFEIDTGVLYLQAGALLDYETNPVLNVTVAVDDSSVGTTPDAIAPLSLTVTDVAILTVTIGSSISENGGMTTGTVTRTDSNNSAALIVSLASSDTSAAMVPATVTIAADQSSATFLITATDDALLDGTQTATITASAAESVNGTRNIDVTDFETLTVTIDSSAISENGGNATGTVTRSNTDNSAELVVNLASNDTTEASAPTSVTILANESSATFAITGVDDSFLDGTQMATIIAAANGYANGVRTIDVTDLETLTVTIDASAISENGGSTTGTVTRSNTDHSAVLVVNLASSNISEAAVPTSVILPANQASTTFPITGVDDTLLDGTLAATITATAVGYVNGAQTIDVTDYETLAITVDLASISESSGSATGTVTRSNTDNSAALVANLASSDMSAATAPISVTILANQSSATFPITAVDDTLLDGTQTTMVTATASGYIGGLQAIIVTDLETLIVTIDLPAINENGGSATGTVTRSNTDNSAALVVNLSSNDTSEASVPATVTIPANQASTIFSVTAEDDTLLDGTRTATITASADGYVDGTRSLDVMDYEDLTVTINLSAMSESGGSATGTVTRSNTDNSTALVVNLANDDTTEASVPASVMILANQASVTFTITSVDDSLLDGTQPATITASAGSYVSGFRSIDVTDLETLTITIDLSAISESGGGATGTVTRSNTDNAATLSVSLSSNDTTEVDVPANVMIPANQNFVTFAIAAVDDSLLDGTRTASITAAASGYVNGSRSIEVTDSESLTVVFDLTSISENGGSATGTVTRSNTDNSAPLVVNLTNSLTTEATIPASVTIPANQASATFPINAVDDALLDGTRTVTVTASANGYLNGSRTIDVMDWETLTVTINLSAVSESGGSATGTVTRSNTDRSSALVVSLSSSDISEATVPASVTISANQASTTFIITAVDDTLLDGILAATITASVGGYVSGTRTIDVTDLETLTITIDSSTMIESGDSATGTVTRSNTDTSAALVVNLVSSDTSEAAVPANVTIPPNDSSVTFLITAVDDALLDGTRTATIAASSAGYVSGSRSVDVTDFETLTVTINSASMSESGGSATGTVTRSNTDNSAALVVNLSSSDTSEAAVPPTVTIPATQSSATFPITAINDTLLDGTQTATITATATNYVSSSRTIDITDLETLTVTINLASFSENGGSATGTVTRGNTDISATLLVSLASNDTSEAAVAPTVTIPANQSSITFPITAADDSLLDGTRTVTITAAATGYLDGSRSINVTDFETLTVTVDLAAISEKDGSVLGTVTRSNTDNSASLLVTLMVNDTTEATIPASVTIPANESSATFAITAVDDTLLDGTRTATFTATASGYESGLRTIDVTDFETLTVTINSSAISESGSGTGTVTRSNTDHSLALVVNLASSDTSEVTVPASVTIPANQSTATFPISGLDDVLLDGTQTATITATANGYVSGTRAIDVTDSEVLTVTIDVASISEQGGSATGTVSRSNTDHSIPLTVNLTSSDTTEATVSSSVTIPAGQGSTTFTITAVDDMLLDGMQAATITATAEGYTNGTRSINVTDHETLTVTIDTSTISENGGTATGTVTRSNSDSSSALEVNLTSNDTSEAVTPTMVIIPANQSLATFPITGIDDTLLDGTRTATITASSTGYVNGAQTLDVTDFEFLTVTINLPAIAESGGSATGTVTRSNSDNSVALTVSLTSSDMTEAAVPDSVTILAGQSSVAFPISAIDDALLDGPQSIVVSATAAGYLTGNVNLNVIDDEALAVTINVSAISEQGGNAVGTVTRSSLDDLSQPLVVTLASSDVTEAIVPISVTLEAGQAAANFAIDAQDDKLLDGTVVVTISATATGYVAGSAQLEVADHEALSLSLAANSVSEQAGMTTATVTRSNTDDLSTPLVVILTSDAPSEATVPSSVTIAAGNVSVIFNVMGVDDAILDGAQSVALIATATGFDSATETLEVTDYEQLIVEMGSASVSEFGGHALLTVRRTNTDDLLQPLVVTLANPDPSELMAPTVITIPAGSSFITVTVDAVDDKSLDGPQSVDLVASAAGYVSGQATQVVTDHETLSVALAMTAISEQDGNAIATVTRSNTDDLTLPLEIQVASSDVSEAGVPAMITIPAQAASAQFTVTAIDDALLDGTKMVSFSATAVGYVSVDDVLDVTDHETVTLSIAANNIAENSATSLATVTRSNSDTASPLTVMLTTSDVSEAVVPLTVTIPANQSSVTFTVTAADDDLLDGTKHVNISAAAAGYVDGNDSLDVTDHETLSLVLNTTSISERGGIATGTVTRSNSADLSQPLVVVLASSDTSEAVVPATVTIVASQSSASFPITAIDDDLLDGSQSVTISATHTLYAVAGSATLPVDDFESLTITFDVAAFSELGGSATGTVTRGDTGDLSQPVTVTLTTNDASEVSVPASVTIAANSLSATFSATAVDDALLDGTKVVTIDASAPGFIGDAAVLDVTDHETLSLTFDPGTFSEFGGSSTATITRSNTSDVSQPVTVQLNTSDETEATVPQTVTIPAREASVTFAVASVDDNLLDGTQGVTIATSSAGYVGNTAPLDVTDHEVLTLSFNSDVISEQGGQTTGTITRGNTDIDTALTVQLNGSDASEVQIPASATIAAGNTSVTFNILALDDALLDGAQLATVSATATGYVSANAALTVVDHETFNLSVESNSISEFGGMTSITISRSNLDLTAALTVSLVTGDTTELSLPASINIPAGAASRTFNVTAVDDTLLDGSQPVSITASAAGYISAASTIEVTDFELLKLTSSVVEFPENGGGTTVTVMRSNSDLGQPLIVQLSSDDPSQATVPATVTIPASQSAVNVTVTPVDDDLLDGLRTVVILASANGYQAGDIQLAVVDIETLTLSLAANSISERDGSTTATVLRGNSDISTNLNVTIVLDDTTEAAVPATVTILAGQSSAEFTVDARDDNLLDNSQAVSLTVSASGYQPDQATLTVTDNETLTVAILTNSISEAGGLVNATVTRSNTDRSTALLVNLTNADTSEASVPATVTIPAGQASATFGISGVDDQLADGVQTALITAAAAGYNSGSATLNVTDLESLSLTISPATFSEAGGAAVGTVTRLNTNLDQPLTVQVSSDDASEANVPSIVEIPAGQASITFDISAVDDAVLDGTQSVQIEVAAADYTLSTQTLSVTDAETLTLTLATNQIVENGGELTASLSRSDGNVAAPLVVRLNSSHTGRLVLPSTIVIPSGVATSPQFPITVLDNSTLDGDVNLTLTASAAGYESANSQLSIADFELLTLVIAQASISELDGTTTATVRRPAGSAQALTVQLSSADESEATVPATVTIAAGQLQSAPFTITAINDDLLDGLQSVVIRATAAGYVDATQSLEVLDHETLSIELTMSEVAESDGAVSATVTRHNTNLDQPLTVTLQSDDESEATVPVSVSIPAGQAAATFLITPVDDSIVDGTQTVLVRAEATGYVPAEATLDVSDIAFSWHNARLALDVNDDDAVSPLDALIVINEMNAKGSYQLPTDSGGPPYLDVNADEFVSPLDALLVINFLNNGGGAEGESAVRDVVTPVLQPAWHDQTHGSVTMPHRSANPARVRETGTPPPNLSSALVSPPKPTPETIDRAWSELAELDAEFEELLELLVGA